MTEVGIVVRDGVAYLDVGDPELHEAIRESTSFRLEGAAYGRRRGDGVTRLVKNNKCPVGLLDRVCRVIRTAGATIHLEYADTAQAPKARIKMRLFDVTPRDYQNEAYLAAMLNDRGVIRAPTGSGKTLIGTKVIQAKGMHALVIVPTIDLLYQFKDYLTAHLSPDGDDDWGGWEIGQLGDGVVDPRPVTVATARTMAKVLNVAYDTYQFGEVDDADDTYLRPAELRRWVQNIGTVIVDETQILGASSVYNIVTGIPAPNKYGMSASPWRDDGADLMIEAATGPPIFHVTAERLVKHGWLMAPEIHVIDTSSWWVSGAWGSVCASCGRQQLQWAKQCECGCKTFRSQFQEAYKKEIVENPIRNMRLAQIVQDLDRQTLVLVRLVSHGRALAELMPNAIFLSGKDKGHSRQEVFEDVRAGRVKTIICTQIADMGLDIPSLSALVLAGGGKSSTRHLQRLGRVVRVEEGKPTPIVVDPDDSHIHTWFANHAAARRRIERAEWKGLATWIEE